MGGKGSENRIWVLGFRGWGFLKISKVQVPAAFKGSMLSQTELALPG